MESGERLCRYEVPCSPTSEKNDFTQWGRRILCAGVLSMAHGDGIFLGLNKTQGQSLIGYWTGLPFLNENELMVIILNPQDWLVTQYIVVGFGE